MLNQYERGLLEQILIRRGISNKSRINEIEELFNQFFDHELSYIFYKYRQNINAEAIVIGSSFGRDDIHCDLMSVSTASLANSAQDIYFDTLCYEKSVREMHSLKLVIHVLAPFSLRYDESLSKKQFGRMKFNYIVFGEGHNNSEVVQCFEKYNETITFLNDYGTFQEIREEFQNAFFSESSWKTMYDPEQIFSREEISEAEKKVVEAQFNKPYEKTLIENKKILADFCERLSNSNTPILFFLPPLSETYKSIWDENYQIEVLDYLNELRAKYTNVYILNLYKVNLEDEFFRDSYHLNRNGAKFVSKYINKSIDTIMLKRGNDVTGRN